MTSWICQILIFLIKLVEYKLYDYIMTIYYDNYDYHDYICQQLRLSCIFLLLYNIFFFLINLCAKKK